MHQNPHFLKVENYEPYAPLWYGETESACFRSLCYIRWYYITTIAVCQPLLKSFFRLLVFLRISPLSTNWKEKNCEIFRLYKPQLWVYNNKAQIGSSSADIPISWDAPPPFFCHLLPREKRRTQPPPPRGPGVRFFIF